MELNPSTTEKNEDDDIAERVRSGEFYRQSRNAFNLTYHDPMVDRYLYIFITCIALVAVLIALGALFSLLPLRSTVPFIYNTRDIQEDYPVIKLLGERHADANGVLKQFLAANYVRLRESYDISSLDRNASGIMGQSSDSVFSDYQRQMDPRTPDSPIALYQRQAKRRITIVSFQMLSQQGEEQEIEVVFDAFVDSGGERKKTRHAANITFRYADIAVDQDSGKFSPFQFTVTGYNTKRLQE